MNPPPNSEALALARHAAVSWVAEALKQNFTLARATALASERNWGGKIYSASTLESWYYDWRHQGFEALHRQVRKDKGSRKALSPEQCEALIEWRRKHPQLQVKVLVRQLIEKAVLQLGTFSMPSVYRLLTAHQLDAHSLKHSPAPAGGPTKAFECALSNELWMTDLMFGPTLKLASRAKTCADFWIAFARGWPAGAFPTSSTPTRAKSSPNSQRRPLASESASASLTTAPDPPQLS